MADALARRSPLAGEPAFPELRKTTLAEAPPASRFSFRGGDLAAERLAAVFDLAAPAHMRAVTGDRGTLMRLGPDELLVLAPDGDAAALGRDLSAAIGEPHALVDISHRNFGLALSGPVVEPVLAAGNPLDLHIAAFPVGMATRTLLGKAEIVLWRQAPDRFQIECWRSFAPYVQAFLMEAAREFR